MQVAVGAEPRAAGSAGRELGEPRLGLVEQTTSTASGTIETLARVRGGVAGGNLQSVGRQLVKGVVLVHQTCSPTSVKSCPEPLSPFLSYILAGSPLGSLFVTHSAQDMGLSTWFLVGDLVPYF